ncbi:hypothetical protein MKW92_046565 [Papaver armeniacum]|nr:hypothetical protein MKW92_046565 [Papaver armeniacum]
MVEVDRVYSPNGTVLHLKQSKKELFLSKRKVHFWDRVKLGSLIVEHIGLLFAPFYFTWNAFWVALILGVLTLPIGISLSYHRNLSHRSFKLPIYLEYLFAYFGLHAVQGDPMFWVSVHRYHHQFVDTDRDPHSPIEGFWFSHINWVFQHNYLWEKQAYYRFLRRTHALHLLGLALLLYVAGGLPHLIWGMSVRLAVSHHGTFMVNSVCHTWGKRPWNTKDLSKNNWMVGYIAFGEGWHNNHHAFEYSARLGLEWWQLDIPWYFIKLLEYLGVATNVKSTQTKKEPFLSKSQGFFWDGVNLGAITLVHIGLLFAPFYFTWDAFWVAYILAFLTFPIGVSLSYHRNLCHRSFKLPKLLEYLFAYFGVHAAEGDPMFWVSIHRYHHQFTDTDRDPHSPIEGFWFSHINWFFHNSYLWEKCGKPNNVMDLKKQAYYRFLHKTYAFHHLGLALLLYVVGGLPHLIWGMSVRIAVGHHGTFMVNSVCHTWGNRPWNTKDLSKNNWVVGFIAFGEGWHNNHHLDVPWYIIKLLEYLGLATNVKVPTETQKLKYSSENIHNEFQQANN